MPPKVADKKTSVYRGVTKTSKKSWGAKYSSKRIVSTCSTEVEAAHAYDAYLRDCVPEKYFKFANFCPNCRRFKNSLQLSTEQSQCECIANSTAKQNTLRTNSLNSLDGIMNEEEVNYDNLFHGMDEDNILGELLKDDIAAIAVGDVSNIPVTEPIPFERPEHHEADFFSGFDNVSLPENTNCSFSQIQSPYPQYAAPQTFDNCQADSSVVKNSPNPAALVSNDIILKELMLNYSDQSYSESMLYMKISSKFLGQYWRNDRKILQCFPFCAEFDDYYNMKLKSMKHAKKKNCSASVEVFVRMNLKYDKTRMLFLAKICNTHEINNEMLSTISLSKFGEVFEKNWILGKISDHYEYDADKTMGSTTLCFNSDAWKSNYSSSKKRSLPSSSSSSKSGIYALCIIAFCLSEEKACYEKVGYCESGKFKIASTRTLFRKVTKDGLLGTESSDDSSNDYFPAKKKHHVNNIQDGNNDNLFIDELSDSESDMPQSPKSVSDELYRGGTQFVEVPKNDCRDLEVGINKKKPQTQQTDVSPSLSAGCMASWECRYHPKLVLFCCSNLLLAVIELPIFLVLTCIGIFPVLYTCFVVGMNVFGLFDIQHTKFFSPDSASASYHMTNTEVNCGTCLLLELKNPIVRKRILFFVGGKLVVGIASIIVYLLCNLCSFLFMLMFLPNLSEKLRYYANCSCALSLSYSVSVFNDSPNNGGDTTNFI